MFSVWLPTPIYKIKPVFFLLTALALVYLGKNVLITLLGAGLMIYSAWIFWMRFQWRGSGLVR